MVKIILDNEESNYSIDKEANIYSHITNKYLKPKVSKNGYLRVTLYHNNRRYEKYIHRIMMETFCPIIYGDRDEVNHIDSDKTNNKLENLEWCNRHENIKHSIKSGIYSNKHYKIYPDDTIHEICKELEKGVKDKYICRKFNIDQRYLSDIKNGKVRKNISSLYKITNTKKDRISKVKKILKKISRHASETNTSTFKYRV